MTPADWFSTSALLEQAGNHLWQSTVFAAAVLLLTRAFRPSRAHVRYWLWLAASVKFLVPFAALVAIGRLFGPMLEVPVVQPELSYVLLDAASRPFSDPAPAMLPASRSSADVLSLVPDALVAIWLVGTSIQLLVWWVQWRRVAARVRRAAPLGVGRELTLLRRLEAGAGLTPAVRIVAAEGSFEPGVFGVRRPVLLWPNEIGQQLSDEQVEAVLAHELSHIRCRHNLGAAVHTLVTAAFWFHPVVWWIGARLVHEREQACDQDVIRLGGEPQAYAESILRTCRHFVEAPVACVAGVTGSDLDLRIERIMKNDIGETLSHWRKAVLATAASIALVGPVAVGVITAQPLAAQQSSADAPTLAFEVASVKPNKSGDGRVMLGMQPGGRFTATNVPLRLLIRNAYQMQEFQIVGGPDWIASDRFDIAAKAEGNPRPAAPGTVGPMQLMLRTLLADRFKLAVRRETREMPIYALVLARSDAKLGPQLRPSTVDCESLRAARERGGPPPALPQPGERPNCGMRMGFGQLSGGGFPVSELASALAPFVQRVVVNRTGLAGPYDLDLTWTPDNVPQRAPGTGSDQPLRVNGANIDPNGPSIFTALQEQLGLKLESERGPVDVLVIDSVEHPTPD